MNSRKTTLLIFTVFIIVCFTKAEGNWLCINTNEIISKMGGCKFSKKFVPNESA